VQLRERLDECVRCLEYVEDVELTGAGEASREFYFLQLSLRT